MGRILGWIVVIVLIVWLSDRHSKKKTQQFQQQRQSQQRRQQLQEQLQQLEQEEQQRQLRRQQQQRAVDTVMDSEEVAECMRTAAVMLGLVKICEQPLWKHKNASAVYSWCNCFDMYEYVKFDTCIHNKDWADALRHLDEPFPDREGLTWGDWFEDAVLNSALNWAKEHEDALSEEDTFQHIGISYSLDPEAEDEYKKDAITFTKKLSFSGKEWLYFQAAKKKTAQKYPEDFYAYDDSEDQFMLNWKIKKGANNYGNNL